ncbi:hypothetical protein BHE74_00045746 [Ensete ventricosum]|nr:hypothetical protein BHE74_00045746 [Ensete ventricosum]
MSRVLSRPSGDFVSIVVIPSSSAPGDSRTADALVAMRSFFNVDSTVTTRRLVEVRNNYFIPSEYELYVPLPGERPYDAFPCGFSLSINALEAGLRFSLHPVIEASNGGGFLLPRWASAPTCIFCCAEMFNLDKMKSDDGAGSGSVALSVASAPTIGDVGVSTTKKSPSSRAGAGLRKRLRKVAAEQPTDASGSIARTSADKGKGMVKLEEVPEREYTMRELCEVEDRVGRISKGRLFSSFLILPSNLTPLCLQGLHFISALFDRVHDAGRLVWSQHEKILTLRAANKELKAGVGQELVAAAERRAKELEGKVEKMWTKLESLRSQRREFEQEVGLLRSSLDGARDDQARLEGDVLSLTEVVAFLEAKLKAEGQKVVAAYKASRGFESGLEKIGRVSYEFRYWVVLEQLQRKHPDIMIELDPFAECSEDANVEMDLDQPFDDDTPSEKQVTLWKDSSTPPPPPPGRLKICFQLSLTIM